MAIRQRGPKRKASTKDKTFSTSEMAEALMSLPELQESFTRADIELALDDRGWLTPGQKTLSEMDPQTRLTLVSKSRLYWLRDPLAKQAVRLWTDYTFGDQGLTYNTTNTETKKKLDAFCKDKRNRKLMSVMGQQKSSKKLLVDGEIFFAIFTESDGSMVLRRFDPLQITDIICDPDDDEHVLGYKRETANNKTLYYLDWTAGDEEAQMLSEQKDSKTNKQIGDNIEENVVIYHLPFDDMSKRGNGLLFTAVDWSREHRRFMEARVAITSALSKFAHKLTVKGGQSLLNQIKSKLESTYAQSGPTMVERQPQTAPGGTWMQNQAMELDQMPRATGAGDARDDSDAIKLMVCAGTGIMLHYFGDPSTGNLATATAMELPMLKMFGGYQKLWMDAYRDIFCIVLGDDDEDSTEAGTNDNADGDGDSDDIDLDLPPILADDLQKLAAFITAASATFPELKVDEILQMLLISLGVNNIDQVMESIKEKRVEIDAQNKADQSHALALAQAGAPKMNGPAAKTPEPAAGEATPNESDQLISMTSEDARLLTEAFNKLAAKL